MIEEARKKGRKKEKKKERKRKIIKGSINRFSTHCHFKNNFFVTARTALSMGAF